MTRNDVWKRGTKHSRRLVVALLIASALTGVVAAAFIARPPWSVPAAILLAASTVGVAVALMLLRNSDADADRSSPRSTGVWSAKRLRRTALVFGVVLVVFAVVTAATLLVPGAALVIEPVRAWSVIVVYGGCGAGLLATGLARIPSAVQSTERPSADPSTDGAEWLRLGRDRGGPDLRTLTAVTSQFQLVQVPLLLVSLLPVLTQLDPWVAAVVIGATVIALVIVGAVIARRSRPAWIARDGSALRQGARMVSAAEIDSAMLSCTPWGPDATERDLLLTLGAPGRFRATVQLRRRGRLALAEAQTTLLTELLAHSSIELPHDEHDPTGRFSKPLYPNHLTKTEAQAVVADPPGDGEPLPIGSW